MWFISKLAYELHQVHSLAAHVIIKIKTSDIAFWTFFSYRNPMLCVLAIFAYVNLEFRSLVELIYRRYKQTMERRIKLAGA